MDLLISPDGMLGRAWKQRLEAEGREFDTITYPQFDLSKSQTLDVVTAKPYETVINCAAWTDVDGAETSEEQATVVNGHGVGELARLCAGAGSLLVHYSTDYVFAGNAEAPYAVDAPLAPLNAYGRSKAVGEEAIRAAGQHHLILRTSWLYAAWANNFLLTMRKLGRDRDKLTVVDDQRGCPTSATHLVDVSLGLIRAKAQGTFHVTDGGECTWFDFASMIVADVNPDCDVQPCSSDAFPRPAKRPAYSVLDLGPTEAIVGSMPSWQTNTAAVLKELRTAEDDAD